MRVLLVALGVLLPIVGACKPDSERGNANPEPKPAVKAAAKMRDQPVPSDEFRAAHRGAARLEFAPKIEEVLDLNLGQAFRVELPRRRSFGVTLRHVDGELGTVTFKRWEPGGWNPREDRTTGAEAGWSWTGKFESSDRTGEHLLFVTASKPMKIYLSIQTNVPEMTP